MLGSMPPLRALSSYCFELVSAVIGKIPVEFISFRTIYPGFLYPGGDLKDDPTYPVLNDPHLHIRRTLTWYNPITWISEGLRTDADVLHAQWWSMPLMPVYLTVCLCFKLRRKPVVFTIHNVRQHEQKFIYTFVAKLLFRCGDHFIVHSERNRVQLSRCFNILPNKISQIHHGPLDFHMKKRAVDRSIVRKDMGYAPEEKVILLFGAIRPYKGIDTAIKAFAKVVANYPEARLLIAGKLWEKWEPYESLIRKLKIEKYIKPHLNYIQSAEVSNYFVTADLVLLPYHHFEAQSGVGATAVSFRKPMIVTDVGGLPELVSNKQQVVPPGDYGQLADRIGACLSDARLLDSMSSGSGEIAGKIAWQKAAAQTLAVYTRVLSDKN
jgi:glycosyltransferase involved in cell wall biosynthesis